jgi:hypothetical protein
MRDTLPAASRTATAVNQHIPQNHTDLWLLAVQRLLNICDFDAQLSL